MSKNLDEKPFYQLTEVPISYDLDSNKDGNLIPIISLEDVKINISLASVMSESDTSLILSPRRLLNIFNFYPNFSEADAAIFYLSLVIPKNKFKDQLIMMQSQTREKVFNDIKTVILNFKVDPLKLISKFDVTGIPPLSSESCSLLFEAIRPFFTQRPIPPTQFTTKWENKELQLSFIEYLSSKKVPEIDFSKTDRRLNTTNLTSQLPFLSQINYCWQSLEFDECALSLTENDPVALGRLLDKLTERSPALILTVLGQTKFRNANIDQLSTRALQKLITQPDSQQLYTALYDISPEFINSVTIALYKEQPLLISILERTTQNQYNDLSLSNNVSFATDLAFAASTTRSLGNFIKNYTAKYTNSALPQILEIVKRRISEHGSKNELYTNTALDDFFDYLYHSFDNYPIEICAIIRNAYSSCCLARTGIKVLIFKLKIPQSKLHEIKQRASMRFSKLIDGEILPDDFAKEISVASTNDPTYFSCVTHYLLTELQYLEKHAQQTVEILAHLIGHLVCEKCLSEKQTNFVLSFIKQSMSEPERSPKFLLSTIALSDMIPDLTSHPQFVFEVVRESQLRDKNTRLYDRLLKICQSMNEPMAINHPKTITLHEKLKQFENPLPPPSNIAQRIELIESNPELIESVISEAIQYTNFLASYVVNLIMDHSKLIDKLCPIITKNGDFSRVCVMAASYFAITMVMDPLFDSPKGGLLRRRFVILGKFIGLLTLAENIPLLSRFLDLKKLLVYSYYQGKLYGVVPFVVSVFMVASPFFKPPNPYTSSILHVLAVIYCTDCIKSSIKQQINRLFANFDINISLFTATPHIFPEKTKDNFDFLMAPFSLLHFVAGSSIERIIQFDESVFNSFIQAYIIIPDSPCFKKHPEKRDIVKAAIAKTAYTHLKSESTKLASMAAATATEFISRDIFGSEYITDIAKDFTKQLCAGLTLFMAPMRISRPLLNSLKDKNGEFIVEWNDEFMSKNYDWITQLFRDIVRLRAWNEVQNNIQQMEDKMNMKTKTKNTVQPNVLQIYSDLNDLSLSQQGFPQFDIQQIKEKMVPTSTEMDEVLKSFHFEQFAQQGNGDQMIPVDDINIQTKIKNCPDFTHISPSIFTLKSMMKSLLTVLSKYPRRDIEMIITQIIERLLSSVPFTYLLSIRSYILSWMRISIQSSFVIVELIKMGAIDPSELDILYSEVLNQEPFNSKNCLFIAQFLNYAICETKVVDVKSMVSTLSIISALPISNIDKDNDISASATTSLEEMNTDMHPLEKSSKLKRIMSFDEPPSFQELYSFNLAIYSNEQDEQQIISASKQCTSCGRPFYDALFASESDRIIRQYLRCACETKDLQVNLSTILDSLHDVITKRGCVIGSDLRAQSSAAATVISLGCDSLENGLKISKFLHKVRPFVCPSFTFCWITLISDRRFIYTLLSNNEGWSDYCVLLSDFVVTVGSINTNSESFSKIYNSLLRLVLVLLHDFNNFVVGCCDVLIDVSPIHLTQLRNIFLSLQPNENVSKIQIQFDKTVNFTDIMNNIFNDNSYDENVLKQIVPQVNSRKESDVFVSFLLSNMPNLQQLKMNTTADEIKVCLSFISVLNLCQTPEQCTMICNSVLDQVRSENTKESIGASKMILYVIVSQDAERNNFPVKDVLIKVIAQRISTPAPHPQQLQYLVRDILSQHAFWSLPSIKMNSSVVNFFMAAKQAFQKK